MTIQTKYFLAFFLIINSINIPFSFAKKKKQKTKSTQILPVKTKEIIETEALFIDAIQANLLGNNKDAINKYKRILDKDPKNDVAMNELSKIYVEIGNLPQAILYSEAAIKLNPNNEYYYINLGEAKFQKGDYLGAAKAYETLIRIKPKEYDYYYDWAFMLTNALKYQDALNVYNLLEKKIGIDESIIQLKQPIWIKTGKVEEAVADIQKLIKLYPNEVNYYGQIGEIYEANKMHEKAIISFNKILEKEPNNANALLAKAEIYRQLKNNIKYKELINKVFINENIDIDSKIMAFIPFIQKIGTDSTLNNTILDMANLLEKAHPNNVKAIAAKADVLYNINKKEEAKKEYIRCVELDTAINGTVWMQLFVLFSELEDYDGLIKYTNKRINTDSTDIFAIFYNAIGNQQKKNFRTTYNVLQKGLNTKTNNKLQLTPQLKLQMLISLGDVSFEIKEYKTSDSAYEAALEMDPNNATTLNNYAYYLSERNDMLEKAEKMSKKSNLLEDRNAAFIDTYAWIMYKMKNYTEALDWIEQAMKVKGAENRPDLWEHYGDIVLKLGDTNNAIKYWKNAIEKGGEKTKLEQKINDSIF